MSNNLTDKQEAFVQALLIPDTSQREAYKIAYNASKMKDNTIDNTASKLLGNPKVKARYDELKAKTNERLEKKFDFTIDSILQDIYEVKEMCMTKQPVMVGTGKDREQLKEFVEFKDGSEEQLGVWKFDSSGALKSLELLGKYKKMFTDRVEAVNTNHNLNEDVSQLSEEELDEKIRKLQNENG